MADPSQNSGPWRRLVGNFIVGGLLLAVIVMLIVPLPKSMLDVLLVSNMAIAVALLLTALFAPQPRSLTVFPTILVLTTLLRVGLGVATTRLILIQADAGTMVAAFGQSAAGGSVIIGLVVFAVITVVQLLVVAKGAERVAEVSARFSLDAMPGKQLAIDADVRSGAIDSVGARAQRAALEQDSQLMGAMDGAMRFVKGDAIASVVIVLINLVGGLGIGIVVNKMSANSALQTYCVLSVGEGLLAQIPSLMSAVAAAMLITRMATTLPTSAGVANDIVTQVFGQPVVLLVTATLMLLLALMPRMPLLPFLSLALVLVSASWWLWQQRKRAPLMWHRDSLQSDGTLAARFTLSVPAMAPAPSRTQRMHALQQVSARVTAQTGCTIASMEWTWSQRRAPSLSVDGSLLAALPAAANIDELVDVTTKALVQHAAEWLSVDDAMHMLQSTRAAHQALVSQVVPDLCSSLQLAELLRGLLRENVMLLDLSPLLNAIASMPSSTETTHLGTRFDRDYMVERIRQRLRRQITNHWAPAGAMSVFTVDPMIEDVVRESLDIRAGTTSLAIEPDIAMDIIAAVRLVSDQNSADSISNSTIIMTSADIRRHLRSLLEAELPDVVVLAPHELLPGTRVTAVGQISLAAHGANT
jgi:type III secretion protein V